MINKIIGSISKLFVLLFNPVFIVVFLIFIVILFGFGSEASFIQGADRMRCSDSGSNKMSCFMEGGGKVTFIEDKFGLRIYDLNWNIVCAKLGYASGVSCPSGSGQVWRRDIHALFNEHLGEQMIIVEGNSEKGQFKSYGICQIREKSCWFYNPFPSEESRDVGLSVSTVTIYFKDGGYVESDACPEFDVGCPKPVVVQEVEEIEQIIEVLIEEETPIEVIAEEIIDDIEEKTGVLEEQIDLVEDLDVEKELKEEIIVELVKNQQVGFFEGIGNFFEGIFTNIRNFFGRFA